MEGCPTCLTLEEWDRRMAAVGRARTDKGRLKAQARALETAQGLLATMTRQENQEGG